MPIETNILFSGAASSARPAVQTETQPAATQTSAPASVIGGPGVRVTVTGSQLDKLVAKVKGESEDVRLDAAKRRIAIILTTLAAINVHITDSQKNTLAQIELLQGQLDDLSDTLDSTTSEKIAADAKIAALEAQITALENAIKNAIKDGEAHRKLVAELKANRAEDDAELKAAESARSKSDAAIAAAQANLNKAKTNLATEKAKSESLQNDIATLESQIASIRSSISEGVSALGDKALESLASALRTTATDVSHVEHETNADHEKEEAKEIANDPLRVIREALDRMDADILKTIEDNQTTLV